MMTAAVATRRAPGRRSARGRIAPWIQRAHRARIEPAREARIQRCPALGVTGRDCLCHAPAPALRRTARVGEPDDAYERQADAIAGRIVAAAHATTAPVTTTGRAAATVGPPASRWKTREPAAAGGRPLAAATRAFMESRFGVDFAHVRVHEGSGAEAAARDLQARAFTLGHEIWLGAGESETDRSLIAHELTHVVQQDATGAAAVVQRQMSCNVPPAAVDLYAVNLPGSSRSPDPDVQRANDAWSQCNTSFRLVGGESWATNLLDLQPPNGVLNEYPTPTRPTVEETTMLAHQPDGTASVHVYQVPTMSAGSLAEAFWPSVHGQEAVVLTNAAPTFALAHELGHALLDDGGHDPDKDNLMARGAVNTGAGYLRCEQCP